MMTEQNGRGFERRLEAVEQAIAGIERRLSGVSSTGNWLDHVIGSISDIEAFDEAMRYGRDFRHSDRPADYYAGKEVGQAF